MATSGSVDWELERDDLITDAYRMAGIIAQTADPSAGQITTATSLLNSLLKNWNVRLKMPLWTLKYGYVLPTTGVSEIDAGPTGGHVTNSYVTTTLTADSASSDTTLTVGSISGISASDYIGIELDDKTMHWTTVNGSPTGSTVTITSGVASAASTGNRVFAYTTKIQRPIRILKAFTRDVSSNNDVPIDIITSHEYMDLGTKTTASYPTKLHYAPLINDGKIYVWPRFNTGDRIIVFQYHRPIEDMDADTDTFDFPQEWTLPTTLQLALLLTPGNGVPQDTYYKIEKQLKVFYKETEDNDYEEGSIYFQPDLRYRGDG